MAIYGAPLVAFYDTLGIPMTYSRLKPPTSSRKGGGHVKEPYEVSMALGARP